MRQVERALANVEALISQNPEPWRNQWSSSVLYQTRDLLQEALAELRGAESTQPEDSGALQREGR
jgi:hypothetical protein